MTNTGLVKVDGQEIAQSTKDILMRELKSGAQGIDFRPTIYKIDHKGFNFYSEADGSSKKTLQGVVILKQKVRGLWKEGEKMPLCSSLDGISGLNRVDDLRHPCLTCPNNKWKSGKGGQGKECKEMRRIMIVENTEDIFPVLLNIPPTSIKIFDAFVSALISKKIALLMTNVKFSLEKAEAQGFKYAKIKMGIGEPLTEAQILKVDAVKQQFAAQFNALDIQPEEEKVDDFCSKEYDPDNEELPV